MSWMEANKKREWKNNNSNKKNNKILSTSNIITSTILKGSFSFWLMTFSFIDWKFDLNLFWLIPSYIGGIIGVNIFGANHANISKLMRLMRLQTKASFSFYRSVHSLICSATRHCRRHEWLDGKTRRDREQFNAKPEICGAVTICVFNVCVSVFFFFWSSNVKFLRPEIGWKSSDKLNRSHNSTFIQWHEALWQWQWTTKFNRCNSPWW